MERQPSSLFYRPPPDRHVFKMRVAGLADKDFFEMEVAKEEIRNHEEFVDFCCMIFNIPCSQFVGRIRKMPNVIVRNDDDVRRFKTFESFEIVLKDYKDHRLEFVRYVN